MEEPSGGGRNSRGGVLGVGGCDIIRVYFLQMIAVARFSEVERLNNRVRVGFFISLLMSDDVGKSP